MIEKVLNTISFSKEQLNQLQKELLENQEFPGIELALAGERSLFLDVIENPEKIDPDFMGSDIPPAAVIELYKFLGISDKETLISLDLQQQAFDALEMPLSQRIDAVNSIEDRMNNLPDIYIFIKKLLPEPYRILDSEINYIALNRIARIALAIQQYRLEENKLPETLDELVGDYLEQIPLDPYDDKPMRYKKLDSGFVVYSVREDLKDDFGKVMPENNEQREGTTWDLPFIVEK